MDLSKLQPKGGIQALSGDDLEDILRAINSASEVGIESFHYRGLKVKWDVDGQLHYLVLQPVD